MTPFAGWTLFGYALIITVCFFLREWLYLKEKEARIKDNELRDRICDYRQNLLDTMADNDIQNLELVRSYRGTSHYLKLVSEYETKSKESLKFFREMTFEDIYESDKPVEEFYTQEVLDKLIWSFDTPEVLPVNNDKVH